MLELAPGLLIAAPTMTDPRFERSVILLAEANDEGALGFVVNRRAPYTFGQLAGEIGIETVDALSAGSVHFGGPVSPERGWILFRSERDADTDDDAIIQVGDTFRVSAAVEVLDRLVQRVQPPPFRLFLGYAGWGPHQLQTELSEGAWLPMELDAELVFDTPEDRLWDEAVRKLGLVPGGFFMGGSAEA